jgi:WD40 repeat protein
MNDAIAIILIWGGLAFLFLQLLPVASGVDNNGNFLASLVSSIKNQFIGNKEVKGIISVFDGAGDFKESTIHSVVNGLNIYDIKISPNNRKLVFAGSNRGLLISRDGGLNWQSFQDKENKINSSAEIHKIIFVSSGRGFLSVFQNGKGIIYQSEDNLSSLIKILEFDDTIINDFDADGKNIYVGLSDGRLIIYSLENQSFRILMNFGSAINNLKSENGLIYLSLEDGGFFVGNKDGKDFERMKFLDDYRGAAQINDFVIDAEDNSLTLYVATDYGLIRSKDAGENWQVFKSLPTENRKVLNVSIGENGIFAVDYDKIYKSKDAGLNWQILYPEIEKGRKISAMAIGNGKIIVGSKNY